LIQVDNKNDQEFSNFGLVYGFSFAFRRAVWNAVRFPDIDFSDDFCSMAKAAESHSVTLLSDKVSFCLHQMHEDNISGCFPLFVLPSFMIDTFFPQAQAYCANLRFESMKPRDAFYAFKRPVANSPIT
jgi:hypothetical protein